MSDITQKWVKLLIPFTNGYSQKYTGTELARITKTPQQSASRYLSILVKQGLIDYDKQGRNKLFYIDLSKQKAYPLFQALESHKALDFQQRAEEASIIINEILNLSETVVIFGSYSAYKFDKKSDIDMIILGRADKAQIKSVKQRYAIQINEHYSSYEEFRSSLKSRNPLAIEILKSHIIFGNVSKTVHLMIGAT